MSRVLHGGPNATGKIYGAGLTGSNSMSSYVKQFADVAAAIREDARLDIYTDPKRVLMSESSTQLLKDFFIKEAFDKNDPMFKNDPQAIKEYSEMLDVQFQNDMRGILENVNGADLNPLVGMTSPIHKQIMMNMVFDKGAIQKAVTDNPRYTLSMEYRYLIDTKGNKIDMVKEQHKLSDAINASAPTKDIELALPEKKTTEIVSQLGGTSIDHLSIITQIVAVKVPGVTIQVGDVLPNADGYVVAGGEIATVASVQDVWYKVDVTFKPGYDTSARIAYGEINITYKKDVAGTVTVTTLNDYINATMEDDRFVISSAYGNIPAVRLRTRLDTSNAHLATCRTSWNTITSYEEIPEAIPINTTISPEEVKDIKAMYGVDQLTKNMEGIKTILTNYKDDGIKFKLDDSYETLTGASKKYGKFDFAPRESYAHDHVEWIAKTFVYWLESYITDMMQVLNDPNMSISVFGDPDLVRRMTPLEVQYTTPDNIGPVELDFVKSVYTNNKRYYEFVGSDKLRGTDELIVILCPRNSERIVYRIVDYQMYISNEIRNAQNPSLPAIHAFERWQFLSYQPVQGRVKILNKSGMKDDVDAVYAQNGHTVG